MKVGGRAVRKIAVLAAVVSLTGASFATGWAVLSGRTRPPLDRRDAARRALDEARANQAFHWAPETLAQAASTFRTAAREERRQDLTLLPLRDYGTASRLFDESEAQSIRALQEATRLAMDTAGRARRQIEEAEALLRRAGALSAGVGLEGSHRALLSEGRRRLAQARMLYEAGEPARAADEADQATRTGHAFLERLEARTARFAEAAAVERWREWIDATIRTSARTGSPAIVVLKEQNELRLYEGGRLVRTYAADMGRANLDDKLHQGDLATPEGRYTIQRKKAGADTRYYKALLLDYPNAADRRRLAAAQRAGDVADALTPGGLIEIHGDGGRGDDWTDGCVALPNDDIDELFARVAEGTPVTIVGGDGTRGRFSSVARASRDRP